MILDPSKKQKKFFLSDMSIIRFYEKKQIYYFFCEHFPRRWVAKKVLFTRPDNLVITSSPYCQRCKLNKECMSLVNKIKEESLG